MENTHFSFHFEYNQKEAIDNGWDSLDCTDLVILGFIKHYFNSAKRVTRFEGRDYIWINTKFLIQQLPTTRIKSERNMKRRLDNLVEAGALLKMPDRHNYPSYALNSRVDKNVNLMTDLSARVDTGVSLGLTDLSNDNHYSLQGEKNYKEKEKEKEKEFDILNSYPSEFRQLMSRFPRTTQLDYEQCYPLWSQLNVNDKRLSKYIMGVYAERINQGCLESIENAESFFNDKEWLKQEWELYYDGHITTDAYGNVRVWDGWEDSDRPSGTESNNGEYV